MTESGILTLFETYKTSVAEKNIDQLMSIYDKNFRAFDTWGVWVYEGLDKWREMNERWFQSLGADRDVVDFDEISVTASENLGSATAIVTYSAVSSAGAILRSMQTRLTWVVTKHADGWKIIHQHTSLPIDGATTRAIFKR